MPINEGELLAACENFFESWFGPAICAPEAMERVEARRKKSKQEFSELLCRFVKVWQPERESGCQKCHEEMLRVKMCEHIAEGEEGWQQHRNLCPSTMAVAALRDEVERLEKLVYVPGLWKCAKCKCSVISTNLHVNASTDRMFSANNQPQICPNECGPMWRVTERDAGNELIDRMEALSKIEDGGSNG